MPLTLRLLGTSRLLVGKCPYCGYSGVHDDTKMACCSCHGPLFIDRVVREVEALTAPKHRRRPSKKQRAVLLAVWENRCAYCDRQFSGDVRLEWDHWVPFSHAGGGKHTVWLPACHHCNAWKSNLIFDTLSEAQNYVLRLWGRHPQKDTAGA